MGLRRVRGVRSTLPNNTIIGRASGGSGKAEVLDLADVARSLETYGAGSSAPVIGLPTGGLAGQVLAIVAGIATWTYTTAITAVGTIATGVWNGTKIGLGYGGTNADLSATGGASQVLKQSSTGAAVTVGQLAASDLSNGTTGSGAVVLAISPALLTTPTAPTAAPGTNTTQLATTAFVTAAVGGAAGSLATDSDVTLSALADNDLLRYQTSDSTWHNVAKNTYSALITVLGTIATGVWQGTKIALGYGGTNADLSATGPGFLQQATPGANVTVSALANSDLPASGVSAGSYTLTSLTVNAQGIITAASSGSAGGSGTVTSVAMSVPTGLSVAGSPITTNGTLAVTWSGLIPLAQGGTHKDLSASGGTSKALMQESVGADITVRQLAYTDISGAVPASAGGYPGDWDDPFIGAWGSGGWGMGGWGGLYYGLIPPSTPGQLWVSRGCAMTPEWGWEGGPVNCAPSASLAISSDHSLVFVRKYTVPAGGRLSLGSNSILRGI